MVKTFLRSTLRRRPFFGAVGYRLWRAYNKTVDYPEKSPLVQTQMLRTDLALTLRRLPSLHDAITLQRRHAAFYADRLSLTSDMFSREPKGAFYNRYLYPITFASREQRDEMAALLLSQNINTIKPVHDVVELASKYYDYKGDCPVSEQLSHSVLVLPSHADLGERQVQRIAEAFNAAWATVGDRARRAAQSPVIEVKATVSMT